MGNIDLLLFPMVLIFRVSFFFLKILMAFTRCIGTTYDYFFHQTAHERALVLGIHSILEMTGIVQWVVYFMTNFLLTDMQNLYCFTQ